jgi:glycosyltransferase involved in cell wall biosynthesis
VPAFSSENSLVLSVIVPAHDEERLIPATLRAIHAAAAGLGEPYEIVVVDDTSTDRTAAEAVAHGARVVSVTHRQISATRNAGGRAARGEYLVFVDADTRVSAAVLDAARAAMRAGAVGGGAWSVQFDGRLSWPARVAVGLTLNTFRALNMTFGCFMFCTRDAFDAVGGLDESLFAAEEVAFSRALARHGRFVLVRPPVVTSGRKFRTFSPRDLARMTVGLVRRGPAALKARERLDVWYGPRRHEPERQELGGPRDHRPA